VSNLEVRTEGRHAVVTGPPRLNITAAPRLREVLSQTVADGTSHIVVDLGGTTFVDSSGLGALVGGLKTARQAGGDLRLAAVSEQVMTILTLTSLNRVLRPFPSVEDAVRDW